MTDQYINIPPIKDNVPDELAMLKERAKLMGISLGGNVGIEALKKKIETKLAGTPEAMPEPLTPPMEAAPGEAPAPKPMTRAQYEQELRAKLRKEKLALVRCRIYNLNPSKRGDQV